MVRLSDEDKAERDRHKRIRQGKEPKQLDMNKRRMVEGFRPIDPMLAAPSDDEPTDYDPSQWVAEYKFDGTRVICQKQGGFVRMFTRTQTERTELFPSIVRELESVLPDDTIVDGELAFLDDDDVSHFKPIHTGRANYESEGLRPVFIIFDVLRADGEDMTDKPFEQRRKVLERIDVSHDQIERSQVYEGNFENLFHTVISSGREGLIMKRRDSNYYTDTRSSMWRKVKATEERDVMVVGYTEGEGDRAETFGSLVLSDGKKYIGRVGTGFDTAELFDIKERLDPIEDDPFVYPDVDKAYTPVEPFVIEVEYLNISENGKLRMPVFKRVRDDKPQEDVRTV